VVLVRDAATVMLVRDRPDLEVLVLQRTPDAVFGPGATVFPGGAVDAADGQVFDRVTGLDDAAASAQHGVDRGGLAFRVAAVRECFEEAGVFLAHDRTGASAPPRVEWRDALNAGRATFEWILASEDLTLHARDLRLFSHWLTPVGAPRRYNTWFFVAPAPEGHEAVHDDVELVASEWVRPKDLLAAGERGEVDLIFPTVRSLSALACFGKAAELIDVLDAVPHDDRGRPVVVPDATGERVRLPFDTDPPNPGWTIPLPDISWRDEARFLAEDLD